MLGGVAVAAIFIFHVFVALYIDNDVPAVYVNEPFPVTTPVIEPGGVLEFETTFCRLDDSVLNLDLWWVNLDTGKQYQGEQFRNLKGRIGCFEIRPSYFSPVNIPPGEYALELKLEFRNNWLNHTNATVRTSSFEIAP